MALGKWFRGNSAATAGPPKDYAVSKPDAAWRNELSAEQYRVLREHGTERPCTRPLNKETRGGMVACAG